MIEKIERKINVLQKKYEDSFIADSASEITAGFSSESAIGSTIICIAEGEVYIKNSKGKWQLFGGTKEI